MNEIDTNEIKSTLFDLSKKYILPLYKNLKDKDIMYKNGGDLVTSVDLLIEEKLNSILCKLLPNSLFVGEECYSKSPEILNYYKEDNYCWTVDPIDGTKNFVKGNNKFAIMLALTFKNEILQSWIYKPLTEEICYAIKDGGSFLNEKSIVINSDSLIENSIGSISSKYWDDHIFNKLQIIKNDFAEVNSYGCIGFEYFDIAMSKREFAILSKLSPWDHIPGVLIIREAGGFDSYFDNGKYMHFMKKNNLVVASNYLLGNKILSLIKE